MNDNQLAFKMDEAARVVGVKTDTIRRAINAGKLRAKRTGKDGGGHYLISRTALAEWFDSLPDA